MTKIFSVDFRKGSYIDSVNKIVGVPTSLSKLIRTDKGTALARVVNHDGVTYTTGSKSLSKFTIVAWIKQRTTDAGDRYGIAIIGNAQIIRRDNSATTYSNYFDSAVLVQLSVPTSTSLNKWMQFVVTYDGTSVISSINNKQLVGSPSSMTATLDYTSITIGRGTTTSRYSDSDILKFEVYDDVISDKELELDYKALLESQVTDKPIKHFELVKPTDLSYLKDDKVGINLTDNYDFDTWLNTGSAFVSKTSNSFTTNNSGGGVSKISLFTIGKKYRMTIRGTTTSGFGVTNTAVSPTYATFGVGDFSSTIDFTVSTNNTIYLRNLAAGTTTITHLSIQEVTGLLLAYNMKPNGSTLVDISGNGNNGTINGAVIQSKEGLFTTDKTSNVLISAGPIITTNTYSVLGRIKINDLMASDGVLFSNDNTTTNEIIDSIGIKGGKLSWNYDTGGTYKAGATTDLPLNSYVDFAFVSDGGRSGVIKLYINGVEDTITSTVFYRSGTGSRLFARSSGTGFLGDCADFRIYNRVLSEQEIKDYHNSFINPVILEDWSGSAVSDVI